MDETVSRSAQPGPVESGRLRAEPAETVLLLVAFAARSMSSRSLGSKPRRRWLAVSAGDEHNAAPSDWMARRGCTPHAKTEPPKPLTTNPPSKAWTQQKCGAAAARWSPSRTPSRGADGDRDRVHLAVPGRFGIAAAQSPSRQCCCRKHSPPAACRAGREPEASSPVAGSKCRRRARRRTTREGSRTTMRSTPYAQSEP